MIKIRPFIITGTEKNKQESINLDEIVIYGNPDTLRQLGIFLINSAYEMEKNDSEHLHFQDEIDNFSGDKHCDVILVNKNIVKKIDK